MATIYRDYGSLNHMSVSNEANVNSRRQVYQATHRGDGTRLPFMTRSFISFTFGGKPIEDFDLIATITNDRLSKSGYANFNDIVTTYDNLDGQYYWNTHYQTNSLTFTLSTDGIEQKTLDEFLYWFHAGETKELILSEHPNRAIMARVSQPPEISLLPFEYDAVITISSEKYKTKTTLYKGDIILNLVMDDPHWYAKQNILGEKDEANNRYVDYYTDVNGNRVSIFASQDALKILYEDGIPLGSMIDNNMLLGDGTYANVENNTSSCVWSLPEVEIVYTEGVPSGEGARINGTISVSDTSDYPAGNYVGVIAGAIVDVTGHGISQLYAEDNPGNNKPQAGYFYYSGTAPAPTRIIFTMVPTVNSSGYVNAPANSYTSSEKPYNSLKIISKTEQELRFTTPNILTSYNKVIDIFIHHIGPGYTWEDVYDEIRDNVRHPAVRAWAAHVLTVYMPQETLSNGTHATVDMNDGNQLIDAMKLFLTDSETGLYFPITFTFDSKTGAATGIFSYRRSTGDTLNDYAIVENKEEDVGDMLYSNYIIIRDRNYPSSDGKILAWRDTTEGVTYSHKLVHDVPTALTNLQILYRNMYL